MEVYWYWLCTTGRGHFFYLGKVEDSATAEISRSQVGSLKAHTLQYNILSYSKRLHLSGLAVDSAPSETGGQWDGSDPSCCQQFGWRSGGRSASSHTLPNKQVENAVQMLQHLLECALEQDSDQKMKWDSHNKKTMYYSDFTIVTGCSCRRCEEIIVQ